jgi:hypothetical protein
MKYSQMIVKVKNSPDLVTVVEPASAAPYLYMAGDNSICDMANPATDSCRIIQVLK